MFPVEFAVPERHDVAGADLVEDLDRRVGHVGVDGGAEGAGADWHEGLRGEGFEEFEDEGWGGAVAGCGVEFGCGGAGDHGAELRGGGF